MMPEAAELGFKSNWNDQWTIGIIMLEVIVGTEIVLELFDFAEVGELLSYLEEYLETGLNRMLNTLLLADIFLDIAEFVNENLEEYPYLIAE